MLYRYWTVRYVPDAVRPDTVGVGVIVADEQNTDSASRFVTKVSDIPNIGGPRKEFLTSLDDLEKELNLRSVSQLDLEPTSTVSGYVERARRQGYGVLQFDPPRTVAGESADAAASLLYQRMIARPGASREYNLRRVRRLVRDGYERSQTVREHLETKPELDVLGDPAAIDLAVVGENYKELSSAFSFLADPSVEFRNRMKAFVADIGEVREGHGRLMSQGHELILPEETPVIVYVEEPREKEQGRLFDAMRQRWEQVGITPLPVDQVHEHVLSVERTLQDA